MFLIQEELQLVWHVAMLFILSQILFDETFSLQIWVKIIKNCEPLNPGASRMWDEVFLLLRTMCCTYISMIYDHFI